MLGCQRHNLVPSAAEERICANQQGRGLLFDQRRESRAEFAFDICGQDNKLHAYARCRLPYVSQLRFSVGILWIYEHSYHNGCGHYLAQQLQALCRQRTCEHTYTSHVAARSVEANDQA